MEQSENLFLQYIDTISATQKRINLNGMYKWLCEYEEQENCSLINMCREQLLAVLQQQAGISLSTIRGNIAALKDFYQWAQSGGYRADNPATAITYQQIDLAQTVKKKCYRNYTDITTMLSRKWTVDEGKAVYPITIFAWLGIPKADAQHLMPNDVDFVAERIIHPSQGKYCVWTDEMRHSLLQYSSFRSSTRDNDITMLRDYSCKTFLYRLEAQNTKRQSEPGRLVDISEELGDASRTLRKYGICDGLAYAEIAKSGALHRMYLMECAGESEETVMQYGTKPLKIPAGYPGDIKLLYSAYKKAFGLK